MHFLLKTFVTIGIICCLSNFVCSTTKLTAANNREYFLSYPLKKNWYQAIRYCTYMGQYLLDIPTPEVQDTIEKIITDSKFNISSEYIWTSGTDLGNEGCFYWASNGHGHVYTNWASGQPDNARSKENCLEIRSNLEFKWNDADCMAEHYFICVKDFNGN